MISRKIKIGTRGSPLALWQANTVKDLLLAQHNLDPQQIEICPIKTSGDKIQDKDLKTVGGKGLFTKEIEEHLLEKDVDIAVHSMKDMPTILPAGLEITCYLERADVRDAFLSYKAKDLQSLPENAVLGTSSLRRQAQIKKLRPDLEVVSYRGNVETRLQKLKDGVVDATLLASAGLTRLGQKDLITSYIEVDEMLPAVAQGAIGIEHREDDMAVKELLDPINHQETELCVKTERSFLARLDGSCQTPIAGLAELISGNKVAFRGEILKPDGTETYNGAGEADRSEAQNLAVEIADQLLKEAGPGFFN